MKYEKGDLVVCRKTNGDLVAGCVRTDVGTSHVSVRLNDDSIVEFETDCVAFEIDNYDDFEDDEPGPVENEPSPGEQFVDAVKEANDSLRKRGLLR